MKILKNNDNINQNENEKADDSNSSGFNLSDDNEITLTDPNTNKNKDDEITLYLKEVYSSLIQKIKEENDLRNESIQAKLLEEEKAANKTTDEFDGFLDGFDQDDLNGDVDLGEIENSESTNKKGGTQSPSKASSHASGKIEVVMSGVSDEVIDAFQGAKKEPETPAQTTKPPSLLSMTNNKPTPSSSLSSSSSSSLTKPPSLLSGGLLKKDTTSSSSPSSSLSSSLSPKPTPQLPSSIASRLLGNVSLVPEKKSELREYVEKFFTPEVYNDIKTKKAQNKFHHIL